MRNADLKLPVLLLLILMGAFLWYFYGQDVSSRRKDNYVDDNIVKANEENFQLIQQIRKIYLHAPSKLEYNLKTKNIENASKGQLAEIMKILGSNKRNGFFIESGAFNGEGDSNTLMLEKNLGWEGVLIEADPTSYAMLIKKNRKAWTVPCCLSNVPKVIMFQQNPGTGKISDKDINSKAKGYAKVQCLPIFTILQALNITTVDYFSLDVEGSELDVLRTIPWNKVNIITLSVEYLHVAEGREAVKNFMESKGYVVFSELLYKNGGNQFKDFIFYHPNLLPVDSPIYGSEISQDFPIHKNIKKS